MFVAKVTGSMIATQKVDAMVGQRLLVVEPYRLDGETRDRLVTTGRTFVAVDTVGAGEGEFVLICQGSSARLTPETKNLPVDMVVIGIVDSVHIDHGCVFPHAGIDQHPVSGERKRVVVQKLGQKFGGQLAQRQWKQIFHQ